MLLQDTELVSPFRFPFDLVNRHRVSACTSVTQKSQLAPAIPLLKLHTEGMLLAVRLLQIQAQKAKTPEKCSYENKHRSLEYDCFRVEEDLLMLFPFSITT